MLNFFKEDKKKDQQTLILETMEAAAFMPLSLTDEERKAFRDLLEVARANPEDPITVTFSGSTWVISKDKIQFI